MDRSSSQVGGERGRGRWGPRVPQDPRPLPEGPPPEARLAPGGVSSKNAWISGGEPPPAELLPAASCNRGHVQQRSKLVEHLLEADLGTVCRISLVGVELLVTVIVSVTVSSNHSYAGRGGRRPAARTSTSHTLGVMGTAASEAAASAASPTTVSRCQSASCCGLLGGVALRRELRGEHWSVKAICKQSSCGPVGTGHSGDRRGAGPGHGVAGRRRGAACNAGGAVLRRGAPGGGRVAQGNAGSARPCRGAAGGGGERPTVI